ncbi:MAG: hypothetical protein QOC86_143, partial [Gaiellales bacterium]|nr:hypothetical protein [Gaiellales bacterium]
MPLVSRAPDVPADAYRIVTPDRFWRFWKLLLG